MTVYVGLLRAVNVGTTSPVRMGPIRDLLLSAGYSDVRTVLQSGNVVFRTRPAVAAKLEGKLETLLASGLGLRTELFIRTGEEWHELLRENPFVQEGEEDPSHLVLTLLKHSPTAAQWSALQRSIRGRERVSPGVRHAFVTYPDGIGTSHLSLAVIERALATHGTSRNWNTVRRLDQLAAS